ncbi:hypothetical protein [Sorangium sp. So ce1000]|uniref:hypothetical protein n=1 Tax=Sorangium sp. So ce1000 TaxID=3133325 RepID=UPI003F63CE9F
MKRAARAALISMAAAAISAAGVAPVRAEPAATPLQVEPVATPLQVEPVATPLQAEPAATPLRARLEFIRGPGAEDCPDEQLLRAETARAMGGVDPYDAEAPFTMTATIERRRGKLAASMFLRDGDGHGRWFDGFSAPDDCKVLVTAMALSIAVLLGDAAELPAPPASAAPARPASPPAPPEGPCSPERPCPPKPAHAPPAPLRTAPPVRALPRSRASPVVGERFRWVAGLDAVTGLGMTPGIAIGPALSIGGRWPAWSVALEVRGLASLPKKIDRVPMEVSLLTMNAALCHHRQLLFACGLSEFGGLRASPDVPLGGASRLNLRAGLGARIGIAWSFSESFSVRGYTDVVQTLTAAEVDRHPSVPGSARALWSAPPASVAFGLGVHASL